MRSVGLVGICLFAAVGIVTACGSAASSSKDAESNTGAGDARCRTRPISLADHPSAVNQGSENGKNLRNVRGWKGRVYFGYGDLNQNTGPVDIVSYDPPTHAWKQHLQIACESVERYVAIGDELWATCSDAHGDENFAPEYASGNANHEWTPHEFTRTIHMMDVTERVPGEVILAGSAYIGGVLTAPGAFLWRSLGGAQFQPIFPDTMGAVEINGGPFGSIASLGGVTFAVTNGSVWTWDGSGKWAHARTSTNPTDPLILGDFIHPVTIANHIVFAGFGNYLWKFDGRFTEALGFRTFVTPTQLGFTEAPVAIFEASADHLLAVVENGDVMMSTDLTTWSCIGKAPPDVRSIGSLDGVVHFGGSRGHAYAYAQASW